MNSDFIFKIKNSYHVIPLAMIINKSGKIFSLTLKISYTISRTHQFIVLGIKINPEGIAFVKRIALLPFQSGNLHLSLHWKT
ncbi:MAG TPA: hypothetical protein DEO33_05710 [Rikenellaceae bacterium]|nr:hypothetical protein [Rikenellaceae bacterium]